MKKKELPTIQQVQEVLRTQTRACRAHELADLLEVPRERYDTFTRQLRAWTQSELLKELPGHRFMLAPVRKTVQVEGMLSVHPRGFGFVRSAHLGEDVFVPSGMLGGAMDGDRVRVVVGQRSTKGLEGSVGDVIERGRTRVQGVARVQRRNAWLEVDDPRLRGLIELEDPDPAYDGKLCVVQITRYPTYPNENPVGRVTDIMGDPGDPKAEVRSILVREQLDDTFSDEIMEEVAALTKTVNAERLRGRRDLRSIPLVTIDPEDARDHDDAIWVGRSGRGYEAWVAIADVSALVAEGSAMDQEAFRRSFTVYLPDRAIPMLPQQLSAHLGSLVTGEDRLCMAVHFTYDETAKLTSSEIVEGVMRSHAGLTYKQAARTLGWMNDQPPTAEAKSMRPMLEALDELTHKLHTQRISRGSLELVIPEARVIVDEKTGLPIGVERRASHPGERQAYRLVEEMMLAANEAVAKWFKQRKAPTVYRIHGSPDIARLTRLETLCSSLGIEFDPSEVETTQGLSNFLARIAPHPLAPILSSYTLRTMAQAVYANQNIGHFGLALDEYVHFTSPIRRYPDLTVHRQIKKILSKDRYGSPMDDNAMKDISLHCTQREKITVSIEREVVALYQAILMQDQIGNTVSGVVTDIKSKSIELSVSVPFVRISVPFNWLGSRQWFVTDNGLRLVARGSGETIKLGSTMEVRIERVDIASRGIFGKKIKQLSTRKSSPSKSHAQRHRTNRKKRRIITTRK